MLDLISRRDSLTGLGFGLMGLSGFTYNLPNTAQAADLPDLETPLGNLTNLLRMSASLDPEDCPWYYNGTIFGIIGEEAPRPLYTFRGMEIYQTKKIEDGRYFFTGGTVSYITDLESGEWLYKFQNPYTGKTNDVPAAVQGHNPERGFNYTVNGVEPNWAADRIPDKPLRLWWTAAGEYVWLHNETVYPPGMPSPRKQRQTNFARREHFTDPSVRKIPSTFTSTFFSPWPRWMKMGDQPGHTIWHASGAKLDSVEDLPSDFYTRIKAEYPRRMTAMPDA
ncbi:MAG: DUF1838 family protein [Rhodospirillaceae bacterium]|nr:DUF1838 family protein [Rhodospirillaceae bacterium]